MGNKVIVLKDDGQFIELVNCIIVGAEEYPDKVVYHKYLFSDCGVETRREMVNRAENYVKQMQKEIP